LLAAPAVIVLVLGWQRRWVADDAFINFRVVNELRAGHGLVFNPGERVEAGTSIAWVLLLAAVRWVVPLRLEWIAVLLGLAGTVTGIVFAQRGATELLDDDDRRRILVPFGMLVVVAVPAMWDFATSGLETGLSFAWLGFTFFVLARLTRAERTRWWVPVVVGFGPVLRPDFALFSAVFGIAMLIAQPEKGVLPRLRTTAIALALPVAVEIFRMAYYANLVPNTALAKEAGRADWNQGWQYLHNFATPYLLWLPFVVVMTALGTYFTNGWPRGRRWQAVAIAPVIAALLHALYVIRLGGDFMHGRFLLPALFTLMLPLAVVPVRGSWSLFPVVIVLLWGVACAGWLRVDQTDRWIGDERAFWRNTTHVGQPVTLNDYKNTIGAAEGNAARELKRTEQGNAALHSGATLGGFQLVPLAPGVKYPLVIEGGPLGVAAYAAPTDVYVLDGLGLAEPIASRMKVKDRGRPGHEKVMPRDWMAARYAAPGTNVEGADVNGTNYARFALACGDLRELKHDITGGTGLGELWRSFIHAPANASLRIPPDAIEAEKKFCGP
jgi:arabinofuranosyltransferase